MADVLCDYGPPGDVPGEHPFVTEWITSKNGPGGVLRPPNGRGGGDVFLRRDLGGCIGGGPTRPAKRPRDALGRFVHVE